MPEIEIKLFTVDVSSDLVDHLRLHRYETDRDGVHFMPFVPDVPKGVAEEQAQLPIHIPGWQH